MSTVFGETLGRYYFDEHGLSFIALRIGWVCGDPSVVDTDLLHAMWLSEDDAAQVVRCAIEADIDFGIYYAISDNLNRRWSMTNTMLELGYRPRDSWSQRHRPTSPSSRAAAPSTTLGRRGRDRP